MRLFVSLRPPAPALAHLRAHLQGTAHGAVERWHLTLVFLGDQPAAAPFESAVAEVAPRHAPFRLRLEGGGSFGAATWAGVGGDVDALHRLQGDVADSCRGAGAELERRRYRPHLTVGRGLPKHLLDGYAGPGWDAGEVELVVSTLGLHVRHEVLTTCPLGR